MASILQTMCPGKLEEDPLVSKEGYFRRENDVFVGGQIHNKGSILCGKF